MDPSAGSFMICLHASSSRRPPSLNSPEETFTPFLHSGLTGAGREDGMLGTIGGRNLQFETHASHLM